MLVEQLQVVPELSFLFKQLVVLERYINAVEVLPQNILFELV
jgi:hypothetical protein